MDLKEQLSPEQFKAVFNVPLAGATYVAVSSGGGFDMVKELTNASKFMAAEAQKGAEGGYGELTTSLLTATTGMSKDDSKSMQILPAATFISVKSSSTSSISPQTYNAAGSAAS